MQGMPLFPERASAFAGDVDAMLFVWLTIAGIVVMGIAVAIVVFAVRYRAGSDADRTMAPLEALQRINRRIEITWIVVPLAIFLAMFGWAARLYAIHAAPPPGALDVYVTGKQWMWRVEHSSGRREVDELHVPVGRPVRLVMTSEDVIHSFFLPQFRLKQDVLPGRYTMLWFSASRTGDFNVFCTQYCGTAHARMIGHLVVMSPDDYAAWSRMGGTGGTMADAGGALFRRLGCGGCHGDNSAVHAPPLEGLFGTRVPLADGSFVLADERYLRDSILLPEKEVAAGYAPIMPSFAGQVGESELAELVEYLKTLGARR